MSDPATPACVLFVLAEFPGFATPLFARMGQELSQLGVSATYLCASPHYERFRKVELARIGPTYYVSDDLREDTRRRELPADFNRWLLYSTFMRQRELTGRHLNDWSDYAALWHCIGKVFDREPSIRAVCSEFPTNSLIACAFALAERRGVPFLGYQAGRVPGYFNIARDEIGIDYAANPTPPVPDAAWLQPPGYAQVPVNRVATLPWSALLRPVVRGLPRLRWRPEERSIEMGSPVPYQARTTLRHFERKLRHLYVDRWLKLFESPTLDPNTRNVLFPLQYRPEASTLVQARYWNDDYEILRNIAFSLRSDARLYVKEHPAAVGVRHADFYQRVRELPAVHLVAPEWPWRANMRLLSGVVCLTSTVGFEALQAGLPVLLMGRTFYEDYPGVTRINTWDGLGEALRALPAPSRLQPVPEVLARYARTCFPGRFAYMSEDCLEPANVRNLTQPLLAAVNSQAPLTRPRRAVEV